jgi:glucokinase
LADPCFLIGDIGGTNARFALTGANGQAWTSELTVMCRDYETAELAIVDYLERTGTCEPDAVCLAAAGPIVDDSAHFTNNHWSIDCRELRNSFRSAKVRLLNDFEAIAYSIPLLAETDLTTVGLEPLAVRDKTNYTIGVLGPGTGLGVAGLMGRGDNIYPIVGEGGHVGFAPENQVQLQVFKQLRERFDRVSDEHLLSGPGLENIYWALCRIHGDRGVHLSAPEIFQRVLLNEDVHAVEALQLFYEALGQVAGNLALELGAYDGIYIAGGIVKRYPDLLKTSSFRSGFENKGRYRSMMERIPTLLIVHPQPGLLGASYCARQMYQA